MEFVTRSANDLGIALAEFRTLRATSQATLAERMAVHRTYLSKIEQGDVTTAIERLWAAFDALGVDVVIRDRPSVARQHLAEAEGGDGSFGDVGFGRR
jgi:transcriptional regulator with XRE-family HTH domain